MTTITHEDKQYILGSLVNENASHSIYRCEDEAGRQLLAQFGDRYVVKNAWILQKLATRAVEIEHVFQKLMHNEENAENTAQSLNYNLGFPELIKSIALEATKDTKWISVNILGFRGVDDIELMIPLVKFQKSGIRVDLRTSAWIMGKLLKIISFAHDFRIEIGRINGNNILIHPDKHYVVVFDWSYATIHDTTLKHLTISEEIKAAAKLVIKVLGTDLEKVVEHNTDYLYINFLKSLANDGESSAKRAHKKFYDIVDLLCENPDSVWEKGFYNFTTHNIGVENGT